MSRCLRLFFFLTLSMVFLASSYAQLTGMKTIGGTTPDYATIKAALQDLTLQGTTAPGVTFVIRAGTYNEDTLIVRTSTATSGSPILIKPDAGATVVINVPAGAAAAIKVDSTRYVTIDGSNNGTTSRDMTINALGTATQHGIWVSGQSYYTTIKNCNIRCNNLTGARGIEFLYTSAAGGNPNNSLAENNHISYCYQGIYSEGNTSTDLVNDLTVRNNVVDSAALAGIYIWYNTRPYVYNNNVSVPIGTGTIYGLYFNGTVLNARVWSNKVHDLATTSATGVIYGLYISGTSTLAQDAFYNNFFWGFNPPDAGTNAVYGIYHSTGNTSFADTIAYNSVNMTGTSTGNKNTFAYYKISATGPAYVRNNIFSNTRTDGTTGVAVAIYKTTVATVVNSNNNNLYVGTPDAQHQTGQISTTKYATIADWRTANASDGASVAENSPFVSATDLHIQTSVPTQLESGGTPVAGITTDIDGGARNATTPDIGGDEFAGIIADLTAPQIAYSALGNTPLTTSRTLSATITDVSGVPTSGTGLPRLYWKKNSGAYTGVTAVFVSGNQYSFTFGSGVVIGDTVAYYIAAQDNASTPNVGVQPSAGAGGFTANPPAASTPPTNPSSYRIVAAPLAAGDYTIGLTLFERAAGKRLTTQTFTRRVMREVPVGPEINHKTAGHETTSRMTPFQSTELREVEETYSVLMENGHPYDGPTRILLTDAQRTELGLGDNVLATYPTITAAVHDLNDRGVTGSVRFLLNDATYPTETFPITVQVTSDSVPTAARRVTFKPNTGVTSTIAGASASAQVLKVLNSYVIIDGSNTNGGTTQNLTIQNTSATAPQVVLFGSTGTTPIVGDTLKNCVVINGLNTSTAVIVSDGAAAGSAGYFSNIGIVNNKIHNSYIGIYCISTVAALNGSGTTVQNNDFNSTSAADSIRYVGVYMQGLDGGIVRGNNIGGISVITAENDKGVWLATGTVNTVVEKNTIHDLGYNGTSGYGGQGVVISSGAANCNISVRNNMIYNLFGDGDAYGTFGAFYDPTGIYSFTATQTGVNIYYNSIYFSGNTLNHAATVYAVGIALDDGCTGTVKNNLVVNNMGLLGTTGVGPVGIAAEISNAQFTAIDYNDYYTNAPAPAVNNIGKIALTDYPTLPGWVTASGGETHSISANVSFVSPTDLHISTTGSTPVDSAATPIAGVTDDFDSQVRNATRPDIGADEFSRVAPINPTITVVARNTRVPNNLDSVVVTCRIVDSTGVGITASSLLYSINGGAPLSVGLPRITGTNTDGTYRGVIPGAANANGNRIEYQIQASSGSGGSTTTAVTANNSYFAGISPLSLTGVRAMNASRALLYANYYARVTGTINGPNYQTTNLGYFFQDAFGGINLFKSGTTTPTLALGDSIILLGKLAQFRGLTEITPDTAILGSDIIRVATGRTVTPITLTLAAFNANPEQYEGMVLKMNSMRRRDVTPPWGPNVNIIVYQTVTTDTTIMRIDSDTEVPSGPEPTYPVNVAGVISQFTSTASVNNDGYEIQPRYFTDFTTPSGGGLSGSYTIGVAGNFTSLSAAVHTLDSAGVSGPVTFLFTDAAYTDTVQLITSYPGQSNTNTVTFKPATGVTPRIVIAGGSATNAGFAIRMDSVAGVIWDGSNSGGTDRSMTIESDTNTTTARTPFTLRRGSHNVTLKNLIIKGNRHSAGGIPSVVVLDNTLFGTSGGQNNITITNCQLMRGNNGIFTSAFSGGVRDSNHTFTNNLIGGAASASVFDDLAAAGISMTGNHNVLVDNNDINGIKVVGGPVGIRINGANTAVTVTRNRIHNLVSLVGSAARPLCFLVGNIIAVGPAVKTRALVANNMVYDIHNFGTGVSGRSFDGIIYNPTGPPNSANGNGSTVEWYYNTWNINYATGEGTGNVNFMFDANFAGSNTTVGMVDSIKFYDNISSIIRADSLAVRNWIVFGEAAAGNLKILSDYNLYNYYVGPFAQIPSPWPGGTTNVFVNAVTDWHDSTGQDAHSRVGNPQFIAATDGHISSVIPTPVESGGSIIAGITADFDGNIRFGSPGYPGHGTAPDIGADEGDFLPAGALHDIGVASITPTSAFDSPVASPAGQPGGSVANQAPVMIQRTELFADQREQLEATSEVSSVVVRSSNTMPKYATAAVNTTTSGSTNGIEVAGANDGSRPVNVTPGSDVLFHVLADTARFRAIVQNFGAFPETTYQVRLTVDGSTISTVNNSRILTAGARDTFNLAWTAGTPGSHVARAFTLLATDANHANDTSSTNFIVTHTSHAGDTLYSFIIPNQLILGIAKLPSNKLVMTSGGQSNTLTTDNKYIVTTMRGALLDTTHLQINNTAGQGFGFRDLAWDGRWLLTSDGTTVRRIDTATYTELRPAITGPGTLQRGLATDGPNRIWKSNFTTDPVTLFDTTGATLKVLGIPTVAPYGIAFDKWTSPNKGYLWYSQPSTTGLYRLSKVDTSTGAILTTYDYSTMFVATGSSGGLDITNSDPNYPGRVVAYMVIQLGIPGGGIIVAIDLGPDSSASTPTPGWTVQTSGTSNYLYSVKAVSQEVAWAAGAAGTVLRTVNHGVSWTSVGGGAIGTADIYNIDAVDANTAFVTTSPAATFIYKTTNGGGLWTQVYTDAGTGAFIDAIHMYNATNGVAYGDPVGGKWVLIYTSNGGSTWVRDTLNAPAQVGGETGTQNGLSAVGTSNIWFNSGVGGRIYKTTNGGTLWTSGIAPFTATSNVWFNNAQYGVATGSTASGVARSTDGGATWTSVTVAGTGFLIACGGSGVNDFWYARGTTIYRSTDKGASFNSSYVGTGTYVGLSFATSGNNTSGWAVTSTGGIAGFYGTITSVPEDHQGTLPTAFALQQNYPNPFNPTTTIRYALPQAARVTLTVYNLLGQRISELTNEVESAGFYTAVWNGRSEAGAQVATGVYFYRIEATPLNGGAPFTNLKKMLLLK